MPQAHLFNALGEHVSVVEVPPFETGFPPVLLWGARSFQRTGGPFTNHYREVFAWVVETPYQVLDLPGSMTPCRD